jgi:TRAP-type mannitol/chloroaromatic compound transport system substrate-binding protein
LSRSLVVGCCAALFGAAAVFPAAADAQTKLRIQSSFPPNTLFNDNAKIFSERVKVLSGGRLEIEMLAPGAVVPAFDGLNATNKKVLDGTYSGPSQWVGLNRAAALFGAGPGGPFGMDVLDYIGWLYEGGGLELYRELYQDQLKMNVHVVPMTTVANQALGWFKRPVSSWGDLKGRKCRETGITAEVFAMSGMVTVNMPGGEIVPSAERGVIECVEFVGAAEDMRVGMHTVFKHFYPLSVHEPATVQEILINGDVWKALPPDLQAIIHAAALEATVRGMVSRNRQDGQALAEMRTKHGVTVHRTPDDVLKKTLESADALHNAEAAKNPFYTKVLESQRAYAALVVPTRRTTVVPYEFVSNHYWPEKK